ncbi:cation diffusion facilitator family transporter [Streptococcus macacae]|uniref:Cation diffusion facilitator family transporter n=1 Tax=Streptococcus macacae NCTC 11558 TaxID=764298 RepID=G5JUY8_9STRE|nr:cation diffusion facilitator family transporter [Streptococcus macacae]EHJ52403.1 cation diffusion facilitator family transporter [Streptococcus macacae NCTC 11558]SUN79285.1 cation efflux system protein [Streptococcus macacae NCTC 11558]
MPHQHSTGQTSSRPIFIAFLANFGFALIEFIFGSLFNSSAIVADAVHDTGDALAIGFSYYFERLSQKKSDQKYTLGYMRFSLLGAILTSVILITGSIIVLVENVGKIQNPEPVNYNGMLGLGIVAVIINFLASRVLHKDSSEQESILSLHFLEDILGWLAVIFVSIILRFTDWYFLDPLLSILIALFILSQALPKFIRNLEIFLEKRPANLNLEDIEAQILTIDQIKGIAQFNVWSFDGRRHVAMIHVMVETEANEALIKDQVHHLFHRYNIVESAVECDHSDFQHLHHNQITNNHSS